MQCVGGWQALAKAARVSGLRVLRSFDETFERRCGGRTAYAMVKRRRPVIP